MGYKSITHCFHCIILENSDKVLYFQWVNVEFLVNFLYPMDVLLDSERDALFPLKTQITDEAVYEALNVLETLSAMAGRGRTNRLTLLAKHADNPVLKEAFRLSTDWRTQIACLMPLAVDSSTDPRGFAANWFEFSEKIAPILSARAVTAVVGKTLIANFLKRCTPLERKIYPKILRQDLEVGIDAALVQKVWPDLGLQFGLPATSSFSPNGMIDKPALIEPIYLGMRLVIVVTDLGRAVTLTERQRPMPIFECIAKQFARVVGSQGIFDGNLYVSGLETELAEQILKSHAKSLDGSIWRSLFFGLRYRVRDFYDLSLFDPRRGCSDPTPFSIRRNRLSQIYAKIVDHNPKTSIKLVPQVESTAVPANSADMWPGSTGVLVRDPTAPAIAGLPTMGLEYRFTPST